jgi:asparagine synthase (glutamine-hydrolysing)
MCGLTGVYSPTTPLHSHEVDLVTRLIEQQRHRGPDGSHVWKEDHVAFGHARLAIIDLTDTGRQPFLSSDGSYTVIFNGEIYNYRELRGTLHAPPASACDGAVIPQLLAERGLDGLRALRGMYAGAAFDSRTRTLTLFRDPFGIKPLFYTHLPSGALAFASEPSHLARLQPTVALRPQQVQRFLQYGSVSGDGCIFDQVECLPANSWRTFGPSGQVSGVIDAGLFDVDASLGLTDVRRAFLQAVDLHLRSDVDTALLLSSGIDSSALAWACREVGVRSNCITVDLGEGRSELSTARETARRYGHIHDVVTRVPDEGLVERYFDAMQQPTVDGLNTLIVSEAIRSAGLKVALSGLGGDEVLGGYPIFRRARTLPALRMLDRSHLSSVAAHGIERFGKPTGRSARVARLLGDKEIRTVRSLASFARELMPPSDVEGLLGTEPPGVGRLSDDHSGLFLNISRIELQEYLGSTLLPDADTFSMACSLELRVPYVDRVLLRSTRAMGAAGRLGKKGFATTIGDPWLTHLTRLPKQGFSVPMDGWMRSGLLARHVAAAMGRDSPVRELLDGSAINRVVGDWRTRKVNWSSAWTIVALDAWLRAESWPARMSAV